MLSFGFYSQRLFFRYPAGWALELGPDGKCLAALLASGAAEVKGTENQY